MNPLANEALRATLTPIDLRLAAFLSAKAEGGMGEIVGLTAALLSSERLRGRSCLRLAEWAGRTFPDEGGAAMPPLKTWADNLRASGLAGDGRAVTPMVLDAGGRVYLYRYWSAERRLAGQVKARLAREAEDADFGKLAPLFRKLFPGEAKEADLQAVAAAACLRKRFAVISGGPGTGKTTTLARVMALLLARDPQTRIALAAPTGKAAARMTDAVAAQAAALALPQALRERMACEARTMHRLLDYSPHDDRFRRNSERPISADAIIIDEASMVDLLLMSALFDAARPEARIILVGDSRQLASVETGYVLGDLCAAAEPAAKSRAFAAAYERLSGRPLAAEADAGPLRDAVVELTRNWRFKDQPGISDFAAAVRAGDAAGAEQVLARGTPDFVHLPPEKYARASDAVAELLPHLRAVIESASAAEALERLASARILCAVRRGPRGVEALNAAAEAALRAAGFNARGDRYAGRPVMVTANDYNVSLFNGDLGVLWPEEGMLRAWFRDPKGALRAVAPARLPPHETAWAMTIHKAQGSEFDEALLVLPDRGSPILTRELLYTAVTRARKRVRLLASAEVVALCVGRTAARPSGLGTAIAQR